MWNPIKSWLEHRRATYHRNRIRYRAEVRDIVENASSPDEMLKRLEQLDERSSGLNIGTE